MTPILEFHNIERSFRKGVPVLNGVTFSMQEGEVLGLLGRNGSGKTTLIRIAMGMLFPQAGAVRVFGLSPTDEPVAVKKRIGYVAEEQVLPAGRSARRGQHVHRRRPGNRLALGSRLTRELTPARPSRTHPHHPSAPAP